MAKRRIGDGTLAVLFLIILGGGILFGPQILNALGLGGGGFDPFDPDPPAQDTVAHKFYVYKRGTSTAVSAPTVYAWYDHDGDGAVDLGEYPNGEIETLAGTTDGLVTSSVEYPIGEDVYYQVIDSSYETEIFVRSRDSIPNAHDGSALAVTNVFLTLTDTGSSRVTTTGAGLLVTSSGDYNYTTHGTTPRCTFQHTATSTDAGVWEDGWTHWGNGKVYAPSFVGMTMTSLDFGDLVPDMSYWDGVYNDGTTAYLWKNVPKAYFYDADDDGAAIFEHVWYFNINDAGDIATIGIYNGVETEDQIIGVWGSAIGTYETDLDFTAQSW